MKLGSCSPRLPTDVMVAVAGLGVKPGIRWPSSTLCCTQVTP